jgi:translation initiation factor 2B subunit (eIF-2B alpha/beta/delta family)
MASVPLPERLAALAANTTAGATELLAEALDILFTARAAGADMQDVASAICQAQPTMAPLWNAAAAAVSDDPERLNRFAERARRAPGALARYAAAHFADDDRRRPLHVVTISYSSSVVAALDAIRLIRAVHVSCSESRPALEGRRLAEHLAAKDIPVTCFGDAAIGHALHGADAVIAGADAVAPYWFLNKSGTRMLAAAATQQGVPVYVAATRDKFVGPHLATRLVMRSGGSAEIWAEAPAAVDVRNPYFESTPLDLVAAVISDIGVLGSGMIPDVCEH